MTKQSVKHTEPDTDRPDIYSGFCIPPVWMIHPAPPAQFFDINKQHFYMVHGQPMAFAPEVSR